LALAFAFVLAEAFAAEADLALVGLVAGAFVVVFFAGVTTQALGWLCS
jgi:hypothetical protein